MDEEKKLYRLKKPSKGFKSTVSIAPSDSECEKDSHEIIRVEEGRKITGHYGNKRISDDFHFENPMLEAEWQLRKELHRVGNLDEMMADGTFAKMGQQYITHLKQTYGEHLERMPEPKFNLSLEERYLVQPSEEPIPVSMIDYLESWKRGISEEYEDKREPEEIPYDERMAHHEKAGYPIGDYLEYVFSDFPKEPGIYFLPNGLTVEIFEPEKGPSDADE